MEIERRTLEVSARYLGELANSRPMLAWCFENHNILETHIDGYNELIEEFNKIDSRSKFLKAMPRAKLLKNLLNKRNLPKVESMCKGNFWLGLINSRNPMLFGQEIANNRSKFVTTGQSEYQIGTPSMKTSAESLVVGTAGHLLERTFFKWSIKNGITPHGGWKKDMWLQGLDDVVMLNILNHKKLHLTPYFTKTNSEGGLGWIKKEKFEEFRKSIQKIQ